MSNFFKENLKREHTSLTFLLLELIEAQTRLAEPDKSMCLGLICLG